MIKNNFSSRNSTNTSIKDQENQFDSFDNTDDEASENENSSTSTEENINDSPKDNFSILAGRLDNFQNSLLGEISNIKAEMENKCNQMI